jgi:uncharacterized membrane protein YciS (DUF1049 family)
MPATNQERENLNELNQERNSEQLEGEKLGVSPHSKPNIIIYIFVGGFALLGDLLALIPVVGFALGWPFSGMVWLWRELGGHAKKKSMEKILKNGLLRIIPISFSNTTFVISTYLENTKLG